MLTIWTEPATPSEYVLAPDVVLVQVEDGTARLLDLAGDFYALPATGAEMLQGVLEHGLAPTVAALAEEYAIEPQQVQADLTAMLRQLEERGLLQKGPTRRRRRNFWSMLALVPFLFLIGWLPLLRLRAGALLILASLSFACFGWARTVAVWQRSVRRRSAAALEEPAVKALDEAVRSAATWLPLQIACKERAIACWTLASWAGMPAKLIVGLELFPLAGHCWCEVGLWTLSDDLDKCEFYSPVLCYE
jgi:hypothetical protein